MPIPKELRAKLQAALERKNWTQRDLHKKTGIAESTISRIFSGEAESAKIQTLSNLANALGLELTLRKKR